jgi:PhzF family phenazine biosynthesis protein
MSDPRAPRRYTVYQVDAFTTERFTGNPAGVVLDAGGLSDAEMQGIARELGNPETAFLGPPDGADHDVTVRYFSPTTEVPLCGHATIAAHYVRARVADAPSGTVVQRSRAGRNRIHVERRANGEHRIVMELGRPAFELPLRGSDRQAVLDALGVSEADARTDCPVQVVSTGHSKVLVGLRSGARLLGLAPDMSALHALSVRTGCNGYLVFALGADVPDVLTTARVFAPAIGIPEDPVTGNGNGPLGAYLVRHGLVPHDGVSLRFRATQGQCVGRRGFVDVHVRIADGVPCSTTVAGDAVIAFVATVEL